MTNCPYAVMTDDYSQVFLRYASKHNNPSLFWKLHEKIPVPEKSDDEATILKIRKDSKKTYTILLSERDKVAYPFRKTTSITSTQKEVKIPVYLRTEEGKDFSKEEETFTAGQYAGMYPQDIHNKTLNGVEKKQYVSQAHIGQIIGIAHPHKLDLLQKIHEIETQSGKPEYSGKPKENIQGFQKMYDIAMRQLNHPIQKHTVIDDFFTGAEKHIFKHPKIAKYINAQFDDLK